MKKELQDRIITAINGYVPTAISDFIEDHKEERESIKNLALTLKHWANPQGGYRIALDKKSLNDDFGYIQKILREPRTLLHEEKNITVEDEKYILDFMRIKLNKIADSVIDEFKLKETIEREKQHDIDQWWKQKSALEQKEIERRYHDLSSVQKKQIVVAPVYESTPVSNYYVMCNCSADLYDSSDSLVDLLYFTNAMLYTPYYHDDYSHHHHHHHSDFDFSSLCGSSHDDSQESEEDKNNRLKFWAILAFIALAFAGIIGGIYAIYQSTLSIKGLFNGEKIASAFRLVAIGSGAYGGVLLGAIIGAALGSAIPVVGTAAGLVLGAIFCSGLFAGLAALVSKPIGEE